jgi:sortase (surface protein transpeptidase)
MTLGVLRANAQSPAPQFLSPQSPAPTTQVSSPPASPRPAPQRSTPQRQVPKRSVPERLDIPAIGVRTDLMSLGLRADGTVQVPPLDEDAPAGWYRHSVTPGEVGSAVILGHVDSARDGPGVFYRLGALAPGDRIVVRRADRSTVTFVVDAVRLIPKADFPTEAVYGRKASPILQLVTCGGRFDRRHGTYRENLIVTASMITTR